MEQEALPPTTATTTKPITDISENQPPGNALTDHLPSGKKLALEEGSTGETKLSKQPQPTNSNGPAEYTEPNEPPTLHESEKRTDTSAFGYTGKPKHTRHHYKRRSTSKIYVSKLLMTKGNDKSSEDGESSGLDSETEQKRLSRNVVGLKRSNSSSSTKRRSKNMSNDLTTVGEWKTEFNTEVKKEGKVEGMVEGKTEEKVESKDGMKNEKQSDRKEFGQESTAQRSSKTPIHSLSTPSTQTNEKRKSKRLSGGPTAAAVQVDGVIVTAPSKVPPGVTNSTVLARDMAGSPGYTKTPSKSKFLLSTPDISPGSTDLPRNNHTMATNLSPSLSQHSEGHHRAVTLQSPSEEDMNFQQSSLNGHAGQAGTTGPTSQSGALSRTQQKLLLQRQHFLAGDDNYLEHPRNMARITREMERINREYSSILLYFHPMEESLRRCMARKKGINRQRANSSHQKYNTVIGIVPDGGKSGSHGSMSGDENQQKWSGSPGKLLGKMLATN